MTPIGSVRRQGDSLRLIIEPDYRPGLTGLEHFSHVIVLWWAGQVLDTQYRHVLQTRPPYAEEHVTGVFACRAEYRPNPIAMTVCKLDSLDEQAGILKVANIDALDGSLILDLKPYFPVCDRVSQASIPEWLAGWPEWMPEEGIGLYDGEGQ
ncbi:MAG: SAM-dependent methyltransferase [Chloroflexi bacterium]|nr:TrmO family methyltransferase [Anaerolineaceae bacterium]NMB86980.1 SAM-dependent methyltransferase [Chloroflexota bacterium]